MTDHEKSHEPPPESEDDVEGHRILPLRDDETIPTGAADKRWRRPIPERDDDVEGHTMLPQTGGPPRDIDR